MNHKCKMCGGVLTTDKERIVTCEYCGTRQTIPLPDNERIAGLYEKADKYRRGLEFDKALVLYEEILNEDSTDAECYWLALLCEFGIEYVEESGVKRIPTINRMQAVSVFDNANYKAALQYATEEQAEIYKAEAEKISGIQKGILEISEKEEPFDIFICYKESDDQGRRTLDSVLAMDLYELLTNEGYKVFFSRVTLDDKIGVAYEPYIYAALQSSKVMIAVGTKPEHYNAVWVRNEWSRYLAMMKSGAKKVLIPAYKDMAPCELPEEFRALQAVNLGELGYQQDLVSGIRKLIKSEQIFSMSSARMGEDSSASADNSKAVIVNSELQEIIQLLEDNNWEEAERKADEILERNPQNIQAQTAKLMAGMGISGKEDYRKWAMRPPEQPILEILGNGSEEDIKELKRLLDLELPEQPDKLYREYKEQFENVKTSKALKQCATVFKSLREYKDSKKLWSQAKDAALDIERQENEEMLRIRTLCASSKIADIELALQIAEESSSMLIQEEGVSYCIEQRRKKEKNRKEGNIFIISYAICTIIILLIIFCS